MLKGNIQQRLNNLNNPVVECSMTIVDIIILLASKFSSLSKHARNWPVIAIFKVIDRH